MSRFLTFRSGKLVLQESMRYMKQSNVLPVAVSDAVQCTALYWVMQCYLVLFGVQYTTYIALYRVLHNAVCDAVHNVV